MKMDETNSANSDHSRERDTTTGEELADISTVIQKDALVVDNVAVAVAGVDTGNVDVDAAVESSSNGDDMMGDDETDAAIKSQDVPESDNSMMKEESKNDTIPERRSSKRQRVPAPYRYSPGEGGGLASKKVKSETSAGVAESMLVSGKGRARIGGGATISTKVKVKPGEEVSRPKPVREWSEPRYRWIGKGVKRDTRSSSVVEYEGVEIDFMRANYDDSIPLPLTVRIGDVVRINSGDSPWTDARQAHDIDYHISEGISLYNDPASNEMGLGALDPYLGLVERLWEVVDGDPSEPLSSSTMMMRTRWFFKKEDLEGVSGRFTVVGANLGNGREAILASMSPQHVILTDQSDDNALSVILGKVKVVKTNPVKQFSDEARANLPKGSYICCYTLSLHPPNSSGEDTTVKLRPCTDDNDDFKASGHQRSSVFDASDTEGNDYNSVRDTTSGESNEDAPLPPSAFPMSPRRIVSEGVTTLGKIRIGPDHQAIIPPQIDLYRKSSFRGMSNPPSERIPAMVWDPASDEGNHVDAFLEESCSMLINHLDILGVQPFHDANYVESPDTSAEAKKPREVDIASLLTVLHECRSDVRKALQKVCGSPEMYMTIWSKSEKEQFDAGYRIYRESIRMIANSVDGSKTCKDAVEYQYRFKFVENFRRFMRKKREKAEEIMATVEDRMLNEALRVDEKSHMDTGTDSSSSDEEGGINSALTNGAGGILAAIPATRIGPLNNRIRTWFRTGGGGKDAVGATQQRRNLACGFLMQVRERVGEEAYDTLSKGIKSCISIQVSDNSLSDVKMIAQDVMKSHPDLLEQFMSFLPEELRSNESTMTSAT